MSSFAYDIVVVGGGHAGIEAALAAARMGASCALVTHDGQEIGRMPCNPAIGGLGKGHLVREIDVLGGEMGVAIDQSGIQYRLLNTKKGPAVQSPRAQADKHEYQKWMTDVCHAQEGLTVVEGDVSGLIVSGADSSRSVGGVRLATGVEITAPRVVLCAGTFMKGLMHIGEKQTEGGREGAASSVGLSGSLADYGFELKRLKTGTPPRLRAQSIDFNELEMQVGDEDPAPFSFRTKVFQPKQAPCYMAYTHTGTHDIISSNLGRSPLFAGAIAGQGPRYCPSIEDKVVRFADKDRHLLFLEPEGLNTDEIYINGLSTSLPTDIQERVVRSVPGLANAEIIRFGYAVEYDSVPSWQIHRHLETKLLSGLYLAGQVLGTSGYEEAAAQGLVAGINAVRSLRGAPFLDLRRDQAYIGVLVDDLVTKEISEPYRMFTSRAEHRLHLRCDNVEDRLGGVAQELGLLPREDLEMLSARAEFVVALKTLLRKTKIKVREKGTGLSAADYLRFPGVDLITMRELADVPNGFWGQVDELSVQLRNKTGNKFLVAGAVFQVVNDIKYEGYIAKHNRLLRDRDHLDNLELPTDIDYSLLTALSFEAREKLNRVRPATLGQAARVDGVRAGDLGVLTVYLKKWKAGKGGVAGG